MKTLLLKAKSGLKVPYPDNPYRYLEGDDPIEVHLQSYHDAMYWERRLMDGDCTAVEAPAPKKGKE